MKQTLQKYLPKEPVQVDAENWFYLENKGICLVHQIMEKGEIIGTDQVTIPWGKIESAVKKMNKAKLKSLGITHPPSTEAKRA